MRRRLTNALVARLAPDLLLYVVSHERSGTHFVMNTLLRNTYLRPGYHNLGEWFGPYDAPEGRFAHIDAFNAGWDTAHRDTAIIKSHCDRPLFEARYRRAKVIYMLRDPRDVLTSFFHYLNRPEFYHYNPQVSDHRCASFADFLRRPVSSYLRHSYSLDGAFSNVAERWAAHVQGWLAATDTLVVWYEELHRDYATVLLRMAGFLGVRRRWRTHPVGLHSARSILPRKGVIGDWRTLFTADDESLVRGAVEYAGIDWKSVIDAN